MNHQEAEENFDEEIKVFLGENTGLMKSAIDQ